QSLLPSSNGPDLNYLLGVINSHLMSWYFLQRSHVAQRDDFPQIVLKETLSLPIRTINFSDRYDKTRHDQLVSLVEQSLELQQSLTRCSSCFTSIRHSPHVIVFDCVTGNCRSMSFICGSSPNASTTSRSHAAQLWSRLLNLPLILPPTAGRAAASRTSNMCGQ